MKKSDRAQGNPGSGKLICIFAFIIGNAMLTGCTGKKSDNKLEVADGYVVDSVYVQVGKYRCEDI
jgi:hypothetical protein